MIPSSSPEIAAGQVWSMNGTSCLIASVGKRLVHYKLFKGKPAGIALTLMDKEALTKVLKDRNAVLVEQ